MRRGIDWGSGDRTGGPIDEVFDALRARFADLWIERLRVMHPADDDNLWYLGRRGTFRDVQIECYEGGQPPFVLEYDTTDEEVNDAQAAAERLAEWLQVLVAEDG